MEILNHRIQILNPDLTFFSSFGGKGSENGQFHSPWDAAYGSTDGGNHRIQVFTADGQFLRKFGNLKSNGNGEPDWPASISIDSEDMVYVTEHNNHRVSVFTSEGKSVTSFGTEGN